MSDEAKRRSVAVADLPPDIQAIINRICRRCGLSTSGQGGAFGYSDGTWSHVLCGGSPLADVCECGDWESDHVLRRGACRICRDAPGGDPGPEPCQRYRFWREEPMPPAMHAGDEPRLPAAEVRPLYDDVNKVEAAIDAHLASASSVGREAQ